MKMTTKATHVSLTPDLEAYLEKRMAGLEKFLPKGEESVIAEVELSHTTTHHKSGPFFRAEIKLNTRGKLYFAAAEREEIKAAIDAMREEIMRELGSSKDKRISLIRKGRREIKNIVRGAAAPKKGKAEAESEEE